MVSSAITAGSFLIAEDLHFKTINGNSDI